MQEATHGSPTSTTPGKDLQDNQVIHMKFSHDCWEKHSHTHTQTLMYAGTLTFSCRAPLRPDSMTPTPKRRCLRKRNVQVRHSTHNHICVLLWVTNKLFLLRCLKSYFQIPCIQIVCRMYVVLVVSSTRTHCGVFSSLQFHSCMEYAFVVFKNIHKGAQ